MLADGGTVHVRPIRPDDAERLVAFHGRLSPESVYFRFFSPKPRLTDKEVEKFTTVDMDDRVALVAAPRRRHRRGGPLRPLARPGRGRGGLHRRRRAPRPGPGHPAARAPRRHRPRPGHQPVHRRGAARQPGHARRVPAGRLRGPQRVLGRHHRRRASTSSRPPHYLETVDRREQRAESRSIARLLRPRSVAVIGASDRKGSVGREIFRNLLNVGFDGAGVPGQPDDARTWPACPAYASVLDIPDDVHLAVVAVPAEEVPGRHRPVRREAGAGRDRREHRLRRRRPGG